MRKTCQQNLLCKLVVTCLHKLQRFITTCELFTRNQMLWFDSFSFLKAIDPFNILCSQFCTRIKTTTNGIAKIAELSWHLAEEVIRSRIEKMQSKTASKHGKEQAANHAQQTLIQIEKFTIPQMINSQCPCKLKT